MDTLLTIRSALANAWISGLLIALEEVRKGKKVGVLFSEEAIKALCGEAFDWSPLFRDRDTVGAIASNAGKMEIPFQSGRDRRQVDMWKLLKGAQEKDIELLACPIWSKLLGIEKFPEGIRTPSLEEFRKMLDETPKVLCL